MRNNLLYILGLLLVVTIMIQACSSEDISYRQYYVNGKRLYEQNCQGCHGAKGEGLGLLYPPLTDTVYIAKNKNQLACIIKNGLKGKVTVNNIVYERDMPGNPALPDMDIAQIIVYISNSFENKRGHYDAAQVSADLKSCK